MVLGHLFLDADRAKFSDPKQAEAYFNIVWAKAFPAGLEGQVRQAGLRSWAGLDSGAEGRLTQGVEAQPSAIRRSRRVLWFLQHHS